MNLYDEKILKLIRKIYAIYMNKMKKSDEFLYVLFQTNSKSAYIPKCKSSDVSVDKCRNELKIIYQDKILSNISLKMRRVYPLIYDNSDMHSKLKKEYFEIYEDRNISEDNKNIKCFKLLEEYFQYLRKTNSISEYEKPMLYTNYLDVAYFDDDKWETLSASYILTGSTKFHSFNTYIKKEDEYVDVREELTPKQDENRYETNRLFLIQKPILIAGINKFSVPLDYNFHIKIIEEIDLTDQLSSIL